MKATESRRAREQSAAQGFRGELTVYLKEELLFVDSRASPLQQAEAILTWWKVRNHRFWFTFNCYNFAALQKNTSHFPILSCIAFDFLPVQGSSVPCERAFSDAGLTDTKRRARLLPENFGVIQTVKAHYKKEHRRRWELVEAQRAAQKKRWDNDSVSQVASGQ